MRGMVLLFFLLLFSLLTTTLSWETSDRPMLSVQVEKNK
jgi:hypothetical protein